MTCLIGVVDPAAVPVVLQLELLCVLLAFAPAESALGPGLRDEVGVLEVDLDPLLGLGVAADWVLGAPSSAKLILSDPEKQIKNVPIIFLRI